MPLPLSFAEATASKATVASGSFSSRRPSIDSRNLIMSQMNVRLLNFARLGSPDTGETKTSGRGESRGYNGDE